MSNRYYDNYIYAIDKAGQTHFVAYSYYGCLGYTYRGEIFIGDKCYSIFCEADDNKIEAMGEYLPRLCLEDCCSYFTKTPTEAIQQALKEAHLENVKILRFIYLDFQSTSSSILSTEGHIISAKSDIDVDAQLFEHAIARFKSDNLEGIANEVLKLIV